MFQMRAPMMVEGVYEPATMKVSIWQKDMAIIAAFAADVGCATPLFTLTQPVYAQAMAMGLSFLATPYPSFRAASTDPVQVLRYE